MESNRSGFMGAREIAVRLGISRQRVVQLQHAWHFPAPVVTLAMGAVYATEDIEAWIAERRPALKAGPQRVVLPRTRSRRVTYPTDSGALDGSS
mgnify:CR=1 FL=1